MRALLHAAPLAALSLAAFLATPTHAAGNTTITFDEPGTPATAVSFVSKGVTFSAPGGSLQLSGDPNGTQGLLAPGTAGPYVPIRADIGGGTSFVSVDLGDYDADADQLFLNVYNSSDTLLGTSTLLIPADFTGLKTLSLSAPGIAYAVFGSGPPSFNGSSVYADNFTYSTDNPVPEASTTVSLGLLLALGMGGVVIAAKRKKAAAV